MTPTLPSPSLPTAPRRAAAHLEPLWTPADDAAYDRHRASRLRTHARSPLRITPGIGSAARLAAAIAAAGITISVLAKAVHDPAASSMNATRTRDLICAETGRVFPARPITDGQTFPAENPATHHRTLFPAELCFWSTNGTVQREPTRVLLNAYLNRPGPTICPHCGREVVYGNPLPPSSLWATASR